MHLRDVTNLGDETVNATTNTVTIADELPAALRASVTSISANWIGDTLGSHRCADMHTCLPELHFQWDDQAI